LKKTKKGKTLKIRMGCDPELFVTNLDGMPRSAYGLVPGTKEAPHKVNKGAIQVDGMALEFNIDPADSEEEWVDNIKTVMQELREACPKEYKFKIAPSVRFNGNHLKAQPDEAKELGCMPDLNAYTGEENPRPNAGTTLRTASGHVHIGFTEGADVKDEEHIMRCRTLAKHLDLFLGIRSLEWDKDKTRRELYGNPGAIRIKPYGLEYRVLSNAWLEREGLVRFVYRQTLACVEDLKTNGSVQPYDYLKTGEGVDLYDLLPHDIKTGNRFYTKHNYGWTKGTGKAALDAAMKLKIGE
jgi:hypothetical protein